MNNDEKHRFYKYSVNVGGAGKEEEVVVWRGGLGEEGGVRVCGERRVVLGVVVWGGVAGVGVWERGEREREGVERRGRGSELIAC